MFNSWKVKGWGEDKWPSYMFLKKRVVHFDDLGLKNDLML